jgi:hypothetical protein
MVDSVEIPSAGLLFDHYADKDFQESPDYVKWRDAYRESERNRKKAEAEEPSIWRIPDEEEVKTTLAEIPNFFFETASEIGLGLAGLIGGEEMRSEAQAGFDDVRNQMRKMGINVGEDTFTLTPEVKQASDIYAMIAPGLGAVGAVNKGMKAAKSFSKLSPKKQFWAKRAVEGSAFGAADFVTADVLDPDFVTFGNFVGGPTEIHPEDDQFTRRAKHAAEGMLFGLGLTTGYQGTKAGVKGAIKPLSKATKTTDVKTPISRTIDNTSHIKTGTEVTARDGTVYRLQGVGKFRAWYSDATGRMVPAPMNDSLNFAARNPQLKDGAARVWLESLDVRPGQEFVYNVQSISRGESRYLPNIDKPFIWNGTTWIDTATKKRASKNFINRLNTLHGTGSKKFTYDPFVGWQNIGADGSKTRIPKGSLTEKLDEIFKPTKVGNKNPEAANPNSTLADAADDAPVGVHEVGENFVNKAPPHALSSLKEAGRQAGNILGFKAVSILDDVAKRAPSLLKIRTAFERLDEFKKGAVKEDFWTTLYSTSGPLKAQLSDALDKLSKTQRRGIPKAVAKAIPGLRTMIGDLTKQQEQDLIRVLRGGQTEDAGIREAAKEIRKILDNIADQAEEAGLNINRRKNYFTRVWDYKKMTSAKGRETLKKQGLTDEQIDEYAEHINLNNGVDDATYQLDLIKTNRERAQQGLAPLRGKPKQNVNLEKARTLLKNVPDNELENVLDNRIYEGLNKYVDNASRRIAYAKTFGADESLLNKWLSDGVKEAKAAGRPIRQQEIDRIYELADAVQQRYNPSRHGNQGLRKTMLGVATYQNIRLLPLSTLASLAEPWVILQRAGPKVFLKSVPAIINTGIRNTFIRPVFRNVPASHAELEARDILKSFDAAQANAVERLTQGFGGEANQFNKVFFDAVLLSQWTKFSRIFADEAGRNLIESNIKHLASGSLKPRHAEKYKRQLRDLLIDPDEAVDWWKRGKPADSEMVQDIRRGRIQFVDSIIVDPRVTNRPYWHSDARWAAVANLKGFQTVFGNTIMKRWLREVAPEWIGGRRLATGGLDNISEKAMKQFWTLATGALMMYTVDQASQIRDFIKYGKDGSPYNKNATPAERWNQALYRTGIPGAFQFAIDAVESDKYGSSPWSALLGPTASQIEQLVKRPESMSVWQQAVPILATSPELRERMRGDSGEGTKVKRGIRSNIQGSVR